MVKLTKKGFTLVEIMIVIAILGLLAAIAIPNFIKARDAAALKMQVINSEAVYRAQLAVCANLNLNASNTATSGYTNEIANWLEGSIPSDLTLGTNMSDRPTY